MGSPDARAYSRNKRGIAGSLIWINFDRHSLLEPHTEVLPAPLSPTSTRSVPSTASVNNGGAVFQSTVVRSAGHPSARDDQRPGHQH